MEEPFNPYAVWLETPGGARPQNYYELFGLKPLQSDREAIAQAADGLRSRIRRIRPGPHMRQWQALLDEIGAARQCLLDPAAKAAYDAQLRNPASPGPAPAAPRAAPAVVAMPPSPITPPARPTPRTTAQPSPEGSPRNPPAMSAPQPPYWPQQPQPVPGYPYPSTPQMPTGVPDGVAGPAETFAPEIFAPPPRPTRRPRQKTGVRRAIESLLLIGCVATAAAFGFVIYLGITGSPNDDSSADREDRSAAAEREADEPVRFIPEKEASPPRAAEARQAIAFKPEDPPQHGGMQGAGPGPPAAKPRVQLAQAQPAREAPAKPEAPSDPAKQAEMKKRLQAAVAAMGQRDLAEAKRKLEEAKANAQSNEDQLLVARYENLLNYLNEFWRGFRSRLANLRSTDEVELGGTRIIIIDASEDRLGYRSEGRVFRYRLETMPGKLVTLLANVWLGKDGQSKVIYGAFQAVDGNAARAQQLWSEAAQAGENVNELLPPLGDIAAAAALRQGAAAPGGGDAAAAGRFRKELAAMKDQADTARGSTHYRELAKKGLGLAQEALEAGCIAEGLILSQLSAELARKAQSPTLARQAAAIERKIEAARKQ